MRDIKNLPFCWQEKKALQLIRDNFKKSQLPLAISLYTILTEQASYFGNDTFKIFGIKLIEQSGIGYKSFREIMNLFIDLKIINYTKGDIHKIPLTQEFIYGESEITILQIGVVQTCTTSCTTSCTLLGQSYKENKEELKEEIYINELENFLIKWNEIFGRNYELTDDLKKAYKTCRKKYTLEQIKIGATTYFRQKVEIRTKEERKQYELHIIKFLSQKNGLPTYL